MREKTAARVSHASGRVAPLEIEDERVGVVGVGVGQRQSLVLLAPCFHVRSEVDLGLLGHPRGFAERHHQLGGARDELTGVTDAVSAVVTVPTWRQRPHATPGVSGPRLVSRVRACKRAS
jgi:hypothetical protein